MQSATLWLMENTMNPDTTYPEGMTPLIAFYMLRNAERHIFSLLPRCHNIYEHPELSAAIADLHIRSLQIGRDIRVALKAS